MLALFNGECFVVVQDDNPLTKTGQTPPAGFTLVSQPADYTPGEYALTGLSQSSPERAYFDGSVANPTLFSWAIGQIATFYTEGIAGPEVPTTSVELYVSFD